MPDAKISALTELAAFPAADDELVVVDKSDTSEAASGTTKRVTRANLLPALGASQFATGAYIGVPASVATGAIDTYYAVRVVWPQRATMTSVRYRVGSTQNGNVRVAIYNANGSKLLDRTTDAAQASANLISAVTLDTPTVVDPGVYWALIWFSSATATFWGTYNAVPQATGTNSGATPTTVTSGGTASADRPILVVG